jgi:transcriptional regulator with XRE-family HTH domain
MIDTMKEVKKEKKPSPKKLPNPIDKHVGSRVRMRRMLIGMSQEKLGESLNLTFQQVQKYEKGTNRIGASRLQQIAQILTVPVDFFFEGSPHAQLPGHTGFSEAPAASYVSDFLSTGEGIQLMKSFVAIRDSKLRKRIVDLIVAIAGDDHNTGKSFVTPNAFDFTS